MYASKKNGEIEIVRFVFCIMIVLYHFSNAYVNFSICPRGYIGDEFLFLTSGLLLAKSSTKLEIVEKDQIPNQTIKLSIRKIKSFWIYYFVAIIVELALELIINSYPVRHFVGGQ